MMTVKTEKNVPVYLANAITPAQAMMVTPEMASEMLSHGRDIQRRVRWTKVRRYARTMARGKWTLTTQAIGFDIDGNLENGQHRLLAVVESGVSIPAFVIVGLPKEAYEYEDAPVPRNAADYLGQFLPDHLRKNLPLLTSVIKVLIIYERIERFVQRSGSETEDIGRRDYLEFALNHPEIQESIRIATRQSLTGLAATATTRAALHFLFDLVDDEDADAFFNMLGSGAGMHERHPVLVLRNQLIKMRMETGKSIPQQSYIAALMIKAWNAWREGRDISLLRYKPGGAKPEKFPEIK